MEFIRYARIFLAFYTIAMSLLLWKRRKHGIEIVIGFYGLNVLLFYVSYFIGVFGSSVQQLNTWSALIGLHSTLVFAFYCTEKLLMLRRIDKVHQEKEQLLGH